MKKLVWCVVAACGGGGGGPDAAAPVGPISLHAAAGTHVLFRGGDGVVQDIVAGDDGLATAMSTANTAATVIASSTFYFGYEGLNPGDTVDNVAPDVPPTPERLKPAPSAILPRYENAVQYELLGTSGAIGGTQDSTASPTISTELDANDTPLKTDALVVATTQATSGDGYSIVEHADLTSGAITFPAFQPTPMVSLTVNGLPLVLDAVGIGITRFASSDPSSALAQSHLVGVVPSYHGTLVPVGDISDVSAAFTFNGIEIDYYARGSAADAPVIDASRMPHVGISPKWSGAKVVWQETTEGVDPLLTSVSLNYDGKQIIVVAPYTGPSLELPPLPDTIDVSETSSIFVTVAATMGFAPGTRYLDAIPQQYAPRWKVHILQ